MALDARLPAESARAAEPAPEDAGIAHAEGCSGSSTNLEWCHSETMITVATVSIDKIRENQRRIYEHIGRYTAASAGLDQLLGRLLAGLSLKPATTFGAKVNRLAESPQMNAWTEWGALHTWLNEIKDYRNRLAHSSLVCESLSRQVK